MKVAIVGPHGSGNRLVRRVVEHAFPQVECGVRSFPMAYEGSSIAPGMLMRRDFIPDYHFVTMRELSPWCMVREKRRGATDLDAAIDLWVEAYRQIHYALPWFWDRPDVQLIRYRDFIDLGADAVIAQMAEMIPLEPSDVPFGEEIVDGDTKYDVDFEFWSAERWPDEVMRMSL